MAEASRDGCGGAWCDDGDVRGITADMKRDVSRRDVKRDVSRRDVKRNGRAELPQRGGGAEQPRRAVWASACGVGLGVASACFAVWAWWRGCACGRDARRAVMRQWW